MKQAFIGAVFAMFLFIFTIVVMPWIWELSHYSAQHAKIFFEGTP